MTDAAFSSETAAPVHRVVQGLRAADRTVATAESLTGGLIVAALVDVPGASDVVRGGLVTYATDLKGSLAHVPGDLLARSGPVDPEVALAMARGAAAVCGADVGLASTGVAGPEPQGGQSVGTVFIAVSARDHEEVRELHLTGARAEIRHATVTAALQLLLELVDTVS